MPWFNEMQFLVAAVRFADPAGADEFAFDRLADLVLCLILGCISRNSIASKEY